MSQKYDNHLIEISIKNPEEFQLLRLTLQSCFGAYFYFRGHSNSQWVLSSSLERLCYDEITEEEEDIDAAYIGNINYYENDLLKTLQRELPTYLSSIKIPELNDYAGWLALIQHYGGNTRLLDFTESFYIALFFATHFGQEIIYSKSSVFGINYISESISEYGKERKQFDYLSHRFNNIYRAFYHNDILEENKIFLLEPISTNKRMIQQKGMFLYGANFDSNFLSNLFQCQEKDVKSILDNRRIINISEFKENVRSLAEKLEKSRSIKMIFPQEMNTYIGKELRAMNINRRQLFPDIYGLMKYYYPRQ